jgi:hypothetical protein
MAKARSRAANASVNRLERGDGGVGVHQRLLDGQRLLELFQRLGRLPCLTQPVADGIVAQGQAALEISAVRQVDDRNAVTGRGVTRQRGAATGFGIVGMATDTHNV